MSERRRDIEHASAPSPTPYNMTMCGLVYVLCSNGAVLPES